MASVELRGLTKRYGDLAVVDNVSLTIDHGRLVCLLGPSGCGKTTTLRLIAGFIEPSSGEIRVGDDIVVKLPKLCQEVDRASYALLTDLKQRGLLEDTLVIWGGEFGRTPMNEARNGSKLLGRDHNPHAFTTWFAAQASSAASTTARPTSSASRPCRIA